MRVDSDDALEQAAIRAEVAKYLFSNGLGVIFTASIVSVLLAYMLWESSSHALLIGWLVLIDIVYLARIALGRVYQRAAPKDGNLWL
jgi:F0F1-type ATP synthase assembly protein I